jgi:hypothetical protein
VGSTDGDARGRRLAARALVVLASAAMVLALAAGYVRRAAVDSDQFANRATAALQDGTVRALIAERVTDRLVLQRQSNLTTARPIIQSIASEVVASRAFTSLFRSAVRDVHRAVFQRDQSTVTLTLTDVSAVLGVALERLRPSLARQVEAAGPVALLTRDLGDVNRKLLRLPERIRLLAVILLVLCAALMAGALAVSPDRRGTTVDLGLGAACAGAALVVGLGILRSLAIHHFDGPDAQAVARAVWDAYLGDLRTAAWILAGSGAVVAAAATSLLRPVELGEPLRRVARWLAAEPARPALRALRAAALAVAGVIVLIEPDAVLQLLLAALGLYLLFAGASGLLRLVYRPPVPAEARRRQRALLARGRSLAIVLIPVAAIVAAVAIFVDAGGATTPPPAMGPCDGHAALCDRPLNEVALPATHNSMSAPLPGFFSSQQDRPIPTQLRDGIRGLLIDTHYADRLPNGRLRTDFAGREEMLREAHQDGVSEDTVKAALRIRDRLGFAGQGTRAMYLCHTFCELGGTPLASVLRDLRDFLLAHPGDVVVVINQDYVTPADFVAAVDDAGLGGLVYRGPVSDGHWLTLRQMIDRSERVLFLAENHAGAAPWYHSAYDSITQETPFSFSRVAQLTTPAALPAGCKPNRGPADAPLFLINHWITTDPRPLPANAAKVNAYEPLLARVRECERLRKHFPNLIAVDFYRRGDLFRVVDTLNGVGS